MGIFTRRPIVGVMGSGTEEFRSLAEPLGRLIAQMGVHLLTGGGKGVMASVSQAFAEAPSRSGMVIGILPCREGDPTTPKLGYPNPWVEIAIPTHLSKSGEAGTELQSRNHINILSSDAIIALPGGAGTASETALAVHYKKPIVAFLEKEGQISGLPESIPTLKRLEEVEQFLRSVLSQN